MKRSQIVIRHSLLAALLLLTASFTVSAAETEKKSTVASAVKTVSVEKPAAVSAEKPTVSAEEKPAAVSAAPAAKAAPVKKNPFVATYWALLPPLLAILLALLTKEVYFSLFVGIVLGGVFAAEFAPLQTIDLVLNKGLINAVKSTAGIFLFLVLLGAIVGLINRSGASAAFGRWAQKNVKSRSGAVVTTFFLGLLIFIDDYFNCLTVGGVMCPVTDAKRISRAKLAYIIDATAAPICMIAPISSWAAAVSQYVTSKEYSGLELFVRAIPYNFYSLLTILFVFAITFLKIDYGPMAKYEKNAMENGDLFSGKKPLEAENVREETGNGKILDMLVPLLLLVGFCVFALLYCGGILKGNDIVTSFSSTDASVALPWGALTAIILIIFYYGIRRTVPFKKAVECLPKGFIAMVPAIMILTLATSLKNMTELLHVKDFISASLAGCAPELTRFLPAVIFLVACGLSFSTGTAWGTFGLLIPITIAVIPNTDPLFFVGISACLAGAVCGDHCSPISDTTIMSAAGAQCDLISHTSTQLPYALTVAVISCIGFLLAGFISQWWLVFAILLIVMIGFLLLVKALKGKTA